MASIRLSKCSAYTPLHGATARSASGRRSPAPKPETSAGSSSSRAWQTAARKHAAIAGYMTFVSSAPGPARRPPIAHIEPRFATLDVAQQEIKRQQKEKAAQDLVVDRSPAHGRRQARVDDPQNLRPQVRPRAIPSSAPRCFPATAGWLFASRTRRRGTAAHPRQRGKTVPGNTRSPPAGGCCRALWERTAPAPDRETEWTSCRRFSQPKSS